MSAYGTERSARAHTEPGIRTQGRPMVFGNKQVTAAVLVGVLALVVGILAVAA